MRRLLLRDDYRKAVEQLWVVSDVENLLDFILKLLRYRHLRNLDAPVPINRRARDFMLKAFEKMRVLPPSLTATEVNMPTGHRYGIGVGGFGQVFKAKYRGLAVGLKVLHRPDSDLVSWSCRLSSFKFHFGLPAAFYREALMWRSLKHKFVLPFLGIHEPGNGITSRLCLVSPYMKNDTLI